MTIFSFWTTAKTFDDLSRDAQLIFSRIFLVTSISHFSSTHLSDFMRIVRDFSISLDSITENNKIRWMHIKRDRFSINFRIRVFRIYSIDIKNLRNHNRISNRIRELNQMTLAMFQRLLCRLLLNILKKNRHSNQTSDRINLLFFNISNNSRESIIRTNLRMRISTITTRNSKKTFKCSMMIRNHTTIISHTIAMTIIMKTDRTRRSWNLQQRRS
jgi:hypothetical protein